MKKIISLIMSLILCFSLVSVGVSVQADTVPYEDFQYFATSETTATLQFYLGYDSQVVIPESINGLSINKIGTHAFAGLDFITSVTIPDTVKIIEANAFSLCSNLKTVKFGNSVKIISEGAFANTALKKVELPASLESFNPRAFSFAEKITAFSIPSDAKYYCTVGDVLFSKDKKELIAYPCAKAKTSYIVPKGVIRIEQRAFMSSCKLKRITFPTTLKTIDVEAFYGSHITNAVIPNSVKAINSRAFKTSYLKSVTIGKNVELVGTGAFYNCISLKTINLNKKNKEYTLIDGVLFTKNKKALITYPIGKTATSYTIPKGTVTIGEYAFATSQYLKKINCNAQLKNINQYAFVDCLYLSSITLPKSLRKIEKFAFSGCFIKSVTLPKGLTKIGDFAFAGNPISKITLPSTLTSIGLAAFASTNIKTVTVPGSVAKIGQEAFANCMKLTTVVIKSGVKEIGHFAFASCPKLTSVTIPKSVKTFGDSVFGWEDFSGTIKCKKNSQAHKYAKEYGIKTKFI